MHILILAAGYGVRLYPLTKDTPKPLMPINDKPLLNFLMEKIESLKEDFSIGKVRLVSNNKFYKKFLHWKDKYHFNVEVLNDGSNSPEDRLGAVRDIQFGIGKDTEDWLILGGDNLFEDSLKDFLNFAQRRQVILVGLFDIQDRQKARHFGVVRMDSEARIVEFKEKPPQPPSSLVASCIYYFPSFSLSLIEQFLREDTTADAAGKYISWLATKEIVLGYILKGAWLDIGHHQTLKEAERIFGKKL